MPTVSIREVALRAGVSRATVSRVLNSDTEALVADRTRERVRKAASELGYHPSVVARGLAGKPMSSVGVIMAYDLASVTSDPYLGPLLDGILEANKQNRQKTVLFTEDDWNRAVENLPTYCDGHCDGLLLISPDTSSPIVAILEGKRTPFVVIEDTARASPGPLRTEQENTHTTGPIPLPPAEFLPLRQVGARAVERLLAQIREGLPPEGCLSEEAVVSVSSENTSAKGDVPKPGLF